MEVYLSQEADYQNFLPDGRYFEWQSQEVFANRLAALKGADLNRHADQVAIISNDALLNKRRRDLRTFLSIIGKCVSRGHYTSVIRHSHSFTEISNSLRSDYDIQKKGIHFFNLLDLAYDPDKTTPMSFYNQYRTVICNNLGKTGDTIKYKDNVQLQTDEKMTPMLEDIVLLNAVERIDKRLPAFLKTHYNHKIRQDDRLMDFKSDIMVRHQTFPNSLKHLTLLNRVLQPSMLSDPSGERKISKTVEKLTTNSSATTRICTVGCAGSLTCPEPSSRITT